MNDDVEYGPNKFSINPFLPSHEYIPDGEPYIFGDRIYIYGSHDLFGTDTFCSGDYVTWSAPLDGLSDWKYEGVIYKRTQDPFVAKLLAKGKKGMMKTHMFAPDIVEIEGKYYLYYGIGISKSGFGVAVADSPVGPFEYIGRVRLPESEKPKGWKDGKDGIDDGDLAFGKGKFVLPNISSYPYDPAVIYANGRLFLYYGLENCHVVELDIKDKRTVLKNKETGQYKSNPLVPGGLASKSKKKEFGGMGMVNGPSIRKIGDIYHLVYYATGPNKCNAMCYATSRSPFGPFKYGGILVSLGNAGHGNQKTPTNYVGNTHGGMVELNGVWNIIYHRHTSNSMGGRQAMVAPLTRNSDGSFSHAEHHSIGFNTSSIPAYYKWPAYMACYLTDAKGVAKLKTASPFIIQKELPFGIVDDHSNKNVFQVVTNTTEGSVVGYKYFDFGLENRNEVELILSVYAKSNGYIDVYIDDAVNGEKIATIYVTKTNDYEDFSSIIEPVTGKHALYFSFYPEDGKILGDFAFFTFK